MEGLPERYLDLGLRLGRHVDGFVNSYYGPAPVREAAEAGDPPREASSGNRPRACSRTSTRTASSIRSGGSGCALSWPRAGRSRAGSTARRPPGLTRSSSSSASGRPASTTPRSPRRTKSWTPPCRETATSAGATAPGAIAVRPGRQAARGHAPADRRVASTGTRARSAPRRARTSTSRSSAASREARTTTTSAASGAASSSTATSRSRQGSSSSWRRTSSIRGTTPSMRARKRSSSSRRGYLEETIALVLAPQALVAEGIAKLAVEMAFGDEAYAVAAAELEPLGVTYDHETAAAIHEASETIGLVGVDAAYRLHELGEPRDAVRDYLLESTLRRPEQVDHILAFIEDPTWRSYVSTYTDGVRLARAYVARRSRPLRHAGDGAADAGGSGPRRVSGRGRVTRRPLRSRRRSADGRRHRVPHARALRRDARRPLRPSRRTTPVRRH